MGVLPPLIVGVFVMLVADAPVRVPVTGVVAATAGFLLLAAVGPHLLRALGARPIRAGVLLLCATALPLATPGFHGVRRWVSIGPVRLHPGAIAAPLLVLTIATLWTRGRPVQAILLLAAAGGGLALQPDAGQAAAMGAAGLALACFPGPRPPTRLGLAAVGLLGCLSPWLRPDPLPPTPWREDIVALAFGAHLALGVAAVAALAAPSVAALHGAVRPVGRSPDRLRRGVILAVYFAVSSAAVSFGEFPIPILGYGASPILGTILGLGLLGADAGDVR